MTIDETGGISRSLSSRTLSGAGWLVASRLITRGIDFFSLLVLARVLMPSDFGLVGIAMTLILIVEAVLEMPANQILVQMRTPTLSHVNTAFTLSTLRASILAIFVALAALPFAFFYHEPRLVVVTLILSFAPVMRGLQSPNMANFAMKIDFRRDMLIEILGKLVGFGGAMIVAFSGGGYWALIVNTVGTPATMAITSYILAPYRPRFSLSEWRPFAHFLGWSSAAQIVGALSWQCDRLILANFVPLRTLGEFSIANDLSYLPEQSIIKPIGRPLMAAFTLVNDDQTRLSRAYGQAADLTFALGMAMMIGLSLLADPLVHFALGPKWIPSIPILSLLSLSLIPPLIYAPAQALAMALRRTDTFLWRSGAELALKLPIIGFGAACFGVGGVVAGRLIVSLIVALVSMTFVKDLVGIPLANQIARPWRTIVGGGLLAFFLWLARDSLKPLTGLELGVGIAAISAAGLGIYIVTLYFLWILAGQPNTGAESAVAARIATLMKRRAKRPGSDQR